VGGYWCCTVLIDETQRGVLRTGKKLRHLSWEEAWKELMRGQIRLMMTVRSFKNMVMRRNNNTETQRQRLLRHETVMRAITQVLANIKGRMRWDVMIILLLRLLYHCPSRCWFLLLFSISHFLIPLSSDTPVRAFSALRFEPFLLVRPPNRVIGWRLTFSSSLTRGWLSSSVVQIMVDFYNDGLWLLLRHRPRKPGSLKRGLTTAIAYFRHSHD